MKTLCSALLDCMILPMQDKMEDWRKHAAIMDKDHSKEYKKLRSDVKKRYDYTFSIFATTASLHCHVL